MNYGKQIAIILFFVALSAYSQDTAFVRKDSADLIIKNYFALYNINTDSARYKNIFYTFYDWRNTRYRMGGNTKKGIDCSHFTAVVYKETFGKEISGSAGSYFEEIDTVFKDKGSIREGDMVFFKIGRRRRRISHVGIYIGNNKFIHSSTHNGVIVSDLDEPYYKKYYFSCGRFKGLQAREPDASFLYGNNAVNLKEFKVESEQKFFKKLKKKRKARRAHRKNRKRRSRKAK